MFSIKKLMAVIGAGVLALSLNTSAKAAAFADVVFVVDQSGSMGGEFAWLNNSINAINTGLSNAGITANYGLAGYERTAGTQSAANKYVDLTANIGDITSAVSSPPGLYGGLERGYHAARWATTGFSWTGGNYAKVIILITDEAADQGSGISEVALGNLMTAGGFLLNVIAPANRQHEWDQAAYSNGPYLGFFDLNYLRNNPTDFTNDFVAAKVQEIRQVPAPAPLLLLSFGLIGMAAFARRRKLA